MTSNGENGGKTAGTEAQDMTTIWKALASMLRQGGQRTVETTLVGMNHRIVDGIVAQAGTAWTPDQDIHIGRGGAQVRKRERHLTLVHISLGLSCRLTGLKLSLCDEVARLK